MLIGAFSQPIELGLKKDGGLKIVLSPAPKLALIGLRASSDQSNPTRVTPPG